MSASATVRRSVNISLPFLHSASRSRGLLTSIGVFATLLVAINLLSAHPMGYFDLSYMSAGGAPLALAAIGQTLVILTGGFDLSCGAVISLTNVLLATHMGDSVELELGWTIAAVAVGAVVGAVNGFFVAFLRLQSIVVTLATMFVVEGTTLLLLDKPGGAVPAAFSSLLTGSVIPDMLPAPLLIIVAVVVLWTLIRRTRFGTALYSVGSDAEAARSSGIAVEHARFSAFVLAGAAYGLAGVMVTAQTSTGDPLVGNPLLLQIFASVVIGGTALGGGRGGCTGSAFGAYSLMLIVNLLLVLEVAAFYSTIVEGLVLITAALGGVANRDMPLFRWIASLGTLARRTRTHRDAVSFEAVCTDQLSIRRVPFIQRHAEALRTTLPAWGCFVLVLGETAWQAGGLSGGYLDALLTLSSFLVVLALGQGSVILTGGLDLSVPWAIALCGILLAGFGGGAAETVWVVPLVLATGAGIGLLNGAGIVLLRLPPIVVTLGMNGILQGVALLYSGGTPSGFAPPPIRWLMTGRLAGVTPVIWALVAFVAGATLLLGRTVFGRRVYAIGNNIRVARLAGVNVGRVTVLVYALSGVCSALAGIMLAGFSGQASLGMGDEYLLPSIAVVVVGGTLITGGRGRYLGMLGGVLLLTALQTLLAGTTVAPSVREIVYGAVVLASVVVLRERVLG